MSSNYPGSLDSFTTKQDGREHKINAAYVNDLQNSVVAVETELGTDPAGSMADLKTRLAIRLHDNGKLKQPQQLVTVGKTNCDYTTITSALASISDAASNKIYTTFVFPGIYNETVFLKNYINIVAIDPKSAIVLQEVTDNNVECHCYLNITIESSSGKGLYIQNSSSVITSDGDISSSSSQAINNKGSLTASGNISSSTILSIFNSGPFLLVKYGIITCNFDASNGYGIMITGGVTIFQHVKFICTHSDALSIYSSAARNVKCMSVWANRDDHANITQLIAGGFNFDADVQ